MTVAQRRGGSPISEYFCISRSEIPETIGTELLVNIPGPVNSGLGSHQWGEGPSGLTGDQDSSKISIVAAMVIPQSAIPGVNSPPIWFLVKS
jgi:hypothetical protein